MIAVECKTAKSTVKKAAKQKHLLLLIVVVQPVSAESNYMLELKFCQV